MPSALEVHTTIVLYKSTFYLLTYSIFLYMTANVSCKSLCVAFVVKIIIYLFLCPKNRWAMNKSKNQIGGMATTRDLAIVTWWSGSGGTWAWFWRPTGFLQFFDTVGLVICPVKIVPEMTYNVSSGTLSIYTVVLEWVKTLQMLSLHSHQ